MAKKKGDKRVRAILQCTECSVPGRSRYYTTRNRINTPAKLELHKYCKFCKKATLFKEVK